MRMRMREERNWLQSVQRKPLWSQRWREGSPGAGCGTAHWTSETNWWRACSISVVRWATMVVGTTPGHSATQPLFQPQSLTTSWTVTVPVFSSTPPRAAMVSLISYNSYLLVVYLCIRAHTGLYRWTFDFDFSAYYTGNYMYIRSRNVPYQYVYVYCKITVALGRDT